MDPKFGRIYKVYVQKDIEVSSNNSQDSDTANIYCFSKDRSGKIVVLNSATKYNLKNYLEQYRLLTENIIIKDPYIINIGINFAINVSKGYQPDKILFNCISKLKEFFNIDKFSIYQPIYISDIESLIYDVNGVRNVSSIEIVNKNYLNGNYSNIIYNINSAIKNNILYPPMDPAIFEVKFPDLDINGKVE